MNAAARKFLVDELKSALAVANVPTLEEFNGAYRKDENGEVVAASPFFKVGYMEAAIKNAINLLQPTRAAKR